MTTKKHNFNIRFYSVSSESGYNFRNLEDHFKNDSMPVVTIGNYSRRIHIFSNNSDFDNSISGYFSTFREDLLHKGNKKTGKEELLNLEDDESIIERNYFTLFYGKEKEILLYHNSSLYGNIRNFESYLTNLTKKISTDKQFHQITMAEIGAEEFLTDNRNTPLTQIEYKISRPRSKKPREDEDPWVQEQFDEMKELGVSTQKVVLYSKNGLLPNTWEKIKILLGLDRTRMLKVTLKDMEQPIDLLHNVLKDKFSINAPSREEVKPEEIFSKIYEMKEKHNDILKEYLDDGE
ncbi:hypothetical protein FXE05_05415 [Aggregatibacter actinomycetemcomitans]|uniref:hypothetical protein n=1 Tax=Aggregatibacter actinomycetemcomitans TaxID=714 RepID=UPI0011D57194|nr:hypothetical protein [Aggregatibacter actinomycetemcomitans]TYA25065.1 hypothetical protein FXE05_05415 [Aggregatibacter actinomycetemcomitans]